MKSFSKKVAVITGAGSGMGRYLAVLLAKAGANVAICEINQTTLAETEADAQRSILSMCNKPYC